MVRHYEKLRVIRSAPKNSYHANPRFETNKGTQKKLSRREKEKHLEVTTQNKKLVKALEDISSTWGK